MAKKKKSTASAPVAPSAPAAYVPETYNSQYSDQINTAMDKVVNWNYDPMQDANYQALAKVYGARGNTAAKNSLADAAALNGGYGTSYAVSAAQQARNQYNQELAALIPDLEANAYSRAQNTLAAYRDADDTAYGRFRDTVSDNQWNWTNQYNAYRDAMSDYQWNLQYQASKKGSGGGGGGRRKSGGYSSGYGSGGSGMPYTEEDFTLAQLRDQKKRQIKNTGKKNGGGGR